MNLSPAKRRILPARWLAILILIAGLLLVVGCGPAEGPDRADNENDAGQVPAVDTPSQGSDDSEPGDAGAYPAPAQAANENAGEGYPPPQEPPTVVHPAQSDAYPAPTVELDGVPLTVNRPVPPGATVVTGEGPPNLNIYIVDMTHMGIMLGSGLIGEDGKYAVNVTPLEENVRIGVSTDSALSGVPDEGIRPGEGGFSVPQVGYFYDSVVVRN